MRSLFSSRQGMSIIEIRGNVPAGAKRFLFPTSFQRIQLNSPTYCSVAAVARIEDYGKKESTPAMEAGIEDHMWTLDEIVRLVN